MSQPAKSYRGPDRRVHRMYVTRNTEYHFRGETCVAVRDRASGTWLPAHLALRHPLAGAVRFHPNGVAVPNEGEPSVGEALYFGGKGRDLVTSRLTAVDRPEKRLVEDYPSASTFIDADEV